MTLEETRRFLYNEENIHNCKDCPMSLGWDEKEFPCLSNRCWVEVHCAAEVVEVAD